jgi:hypothetical protein
MHTKFWSEKTEEKILLLRPSLRWEDNIKIDLTERGWDGVNWIHLDEDGTSDGLL